MRKKRAIKTNKYVVTNKINSNKLAYEYLQQRLDYNPETGIFTWMYRSSNEFKSGYRTSEANCEAWNKRYGNTTAGSLNTNGYIRIVIDYEMHSAHRLAWFYVYGYLPENQIDHKDRVRHHNWIANLREASQQCQSRNAGMLSNNTSGVKGVYFCKKSKKWYAKIAINQKSIGLGVSKNFDEAVLSRWEAEVKYKFPNCCTSSSSYNYLKDKKLI